MVEPIGSLGVQFIGDLSDLEASMRQARGDINSYAASTNRALAKVDKQFAKSGREARQFAKSFSTSLKRAAGVAGVGALVFSVVRLGKEAAISADAYKILQARIKGVTKDTGDYVSVSARLSRISVKNGQALQSTVELFQRLSLGAKDLGASNQQILTFVDSVQKLGIIGGSSQSAQGAGLMQLGQGLSGSILRAEEFNSIIENLPELANAIAKGFGKSTGELRKMVIAGSVLSKDVFAAIMSQTADIQARAAAMPRSMGQGFTALGTSVSAFVGRLDKSLGITKQITNLLTSAADAIDNKTGGVDERKQINDSLSRLKELEAAAQDVIERIARKQEQIAGSVGIQLTAQKRELRSLEKSLDRINRQIVSKTDIIAPQAFDHANRQINQVELRLSRVREQVSALDPELDSLSIFALNAEMAGLERRLQQLRQQAKKWEALADSAEARRDAAASAPIGGVAGGVNNKEKTRLDAEARRVIESIATPQDVFAEKLSMLNRLRETGRITQEQYNRALEVYQKRLESSVLRQAASDSSLVAYIKRIKETRLTIEDLAVGGLQSLEDGLTGVISRSKSAGEAFKDMARSIVNDMARMIARGLILRALGIFGLGNLGGLPGGSGGGAIVKAGDPISLIKAAHGARFKVGGRGGVDSQLVQFMASPNEEVTVRTPAQQRLESMGGRFLEVAGKGGGGDAVTVVQHNSFEAGVTKSQLAEILPLLKQETIDAVYDGIQRSPALAAAVRGA